MIDFARKVFAILLDQYKSALLVFLLYLLGKLDAQGTDCLVGFLKTFVSLTPFLSTISVFKNFFGLVSIFLD